MLRPISLLAVLAIFGGSASRAAAQAQDPLAAPDMRLVGNWKFDFEHSDTVPSSLRSASEAAATAATLAARGRRAASTADTGAAGAAGGGGGGGGRGGGGGGRGGRGGGGGGGGGGARTSVSRPSGNIDTEQSSAYIAEIAPAMLTIAIDAGKTTITSDDDEPVTWLTDKKKRQTSTMKGGLYDMEASWWTKDLQTIRTLANGSVLKRDLKLSKDGNTLEVTIASKLNGKKAELKLKYVKVVA